MRRDTPSFTAAWVAAMRGLGTFLPESLRLVDDPYGLRFAPAMNALVDEPRVERAARRTARFWLRGYVRGFAIYMQLRTRVIDDDAVAFAGGGGRQVVLLGAGFDCRAWRLAALSGATVYEVDHPATQAKKRAVMSGDRPRGRVVFVPWDFEKQPLSALTDRLKREGHDDREPTMTILEGVVMYLSEAALDATFECIALYSSPGSPLAVSYLESSLMHMRKGRWATHHAPVRFVGEPFRSGFDPLDFGGWLSARGFALVRDESAAEAGARLLSRIAPAHAQPHQATLSHFAFARRA